MWSGGREIGVAGAPKYTKMLIRGCGAEESEVGSGSVAGLRGKAVQEVRGGVESLSPVASWKGSLEQQRAHDIVGGADHALSLAVLGGGVGTRHPELDAVGEKEGARGGVVELAAVITLDSFDDAIELSGHPREKVRKSGERVRLQTQRKSPRIVRAIIKNDRIILIARYTDNRGSPQITVYEIKSVYRHR